MRTSIAWVSIGPAVIGEGRLRQAFGSEGNPQRQHLARVGLAIMRLDEANPRWPLLVVSGSLQATSKKNRKKNN